ncbi:MAG: DUF1656 domain-containing protein [Janthinobacterium lividum]
MTGEIAIGGVLVPALLFLALAALLLTVGLTRLLNLAGFYRVVAWRPLVDVTLYLLVLGLVVVVTARYGIAP